MPYAKVIHVTRICHMPYYDLTLPIHNQIITPPQDFITQTQYDIFGTGAISLSTQTGTHIDAPKFLYPQGKSIDQLDLDKLSGPAQVITIPYNAQVIELKHLIDKPIIPGARLLFKTRNSHYLEDDRYHHDYVAFTPQAAAFLADRHPALIGLDYFSIDPHDESEFIAHQQLLSKETIILEAIYLEGVPPGDYHLQALPLPLHQAGSAPARAIITKH